MAMAYRILVVEDNADARELLYFTLRWNGHDADTAESGLEALELLILAQLRCHPDRCEHAGDVRRGSVR